MTDATPLSMLTREQIKADISKAEESAQRAVLMVQILKRAKAANKIMSEAQIPIGKHRRLWNLLIDKADSPQEMRAMVEAYKVAWLPEPPPLKPPGKVVA